MSLDKYINDYLDGNLTPEDDEKLRELISSDYSAKEEFASMLSLHTLLKSDAESISLPKELEEKVEERILAKFLQITPIIEYRRWMRSRVLVSACAIILLFLFFVNVIDDSPLTKSNIIFLSELNKQEQILWDSYPIDFSDGSYQSLATLPFAPKLERKDYGFTTPIAKNQRLVSKISESAISTSIIEQTVENQNIDNANNEAVVFAFAEPPTLLNTLSSLGQNFNNRLLQTSVTNVRRLTETPVKFFNQHNFGFPFVEFHSDELLVSTFSTTDIVKFGMQDIRTKGFGSFSQSIGYKISKNQRFGMEFGYSEFIWNENSVITVPLSTIEAPHRTITTMKNSDTKRYDQILTNGEAFSNPLYVEIPIQLQRERQVYWGSLFYEYYYPIEKIVALS